MQIEANDRQGALRPRVSFILPTYDERANIGRLIDTILAFSKYPTEIVVVDDDSPDKTWQVVEEIARKNIWVRLVRRTGVRGLASALSTGIQMARGEIIVWMDCDFSHPPSLIPALVRTVEKNDAAVASRYVVGGGMIDGVTRQVTSRVLNLFAQAMLGRSFKDYTSGYIAIKREVLAKVPVEYIGLLGYAEYFISLIHRLRRDGYRVVEIPYFYTRRRQGASKTMRSIASLLKIGIICGLAIILLRFKPSGKFFKR